MKDEKTMRHIIIQEIKTSIVHDEQLELAPEDDILTTGILDSLGVMKLVSFLQDEFAITIAPGELVIENFVNVNAMEKFIQSKLSSN